MDVLSNSQTFYEIRNPLSSFTGAEAGVLADEPQVLRYRQKGKQLSMLKDKSELLSPVAAAWIPVVIGGLTGFVALLYQEDG